MIYENPTIADAVKELKVSAKTISNYIEKGIINEPPTIEYGLRTIRTFPPSYIKTCKAQINAHKDKLKKINKKSKVM